MLTLQLFQNKFVKTRDHAARSHSTPSRDGGFSSIPKKIPIVLPRMVVVDIDVHHGNGTQHIFEKDPTVFYLSSHQFPFFPGTGSRHETGIGDGAGTTLNWPLPAGTDGELLIDLYDQGLPDLIESFKPDMVFVSAGYDIHQEDPLGSFNVSTDQVGMLVQTILKHCHDLPVHFSLEGGYNVNALADSVYMTLKTMINGKNAVI